MNSIPAARNNACRALNAIDALLKPARWEFTSLSGIAGGSFFFAPQADSDVRPPLSSTHFALVLPTPGSVEI